MEEWPPTTQGGIYSPLSGGSETLLYLLCAPPPPPLTHRSGGTHPPWGVGPPPAVGRAQFPHSYKQISTPPPPIPLITVATAMVSTILEIPQRSNAIHAWRNGWSIVDCVQLENTSTVLAARRKICLISRFQIFRLEEKTFFVIGVHRPVVALVRSSSAQVCASLRICRVRQCKRSKSVSTIFPAHH